MGVLSSLQKSYLKGAFNVFGLARVFPKLRSEEEKQRNIYHEAAHALVNHELKHGGDPIEVTITPTIFERLDGFQGCFSCSRKNDSVEHLDALIVMLMAGRAAEMHLWGNSYDHTRFIADLDTCHSLISEAHPNLSKLEQNQIIEHSEKVATRIIIDNQAKLEILANEIRIRGTLTKHDIAETVSKHSISSIPQYE